MGEKRPHNLWNKPIPAKEEKRANYLGRNSSYANTSQEIITTIITEFSLVVLEDFYNENPNKEIERQSVSQSPEGKLGPEVTFPEFWSRLVHCLHPTVLSEPLNSNISGLGLYNLAFILLAPNFNDFFFFYLFNKVCFSFFFFFPKSI